MRSSIALVLVLLSYRTESLLVPLELKTFTMEELIPLKPDFFPDRLTVQWISDSEYIFSDPTVGIRKYNADNNSYVTILDVLDLFNLSQYSVASFSKDEKYLLLSSHKRKVYRYSSLAEYYIYDVEKKMNLIPIAQGPLQVVIWGANRSLAYVKNNNVYYVHDCSQPDQVIPLTTDGVPGQVYHGATDWIYEEEVFNAAEAMWFSPEGQYLAVASFNDTEVESAVYPFYGNPGDLNFQYPHEIKFKYPKVGRLNPIVELQVYKPSDPLSDAWNIPAPIDIVGKDHILARVNWATETNLMVLWMNRRQNLAVLTNCDLEKDTCIVVKQRFEEKGWIENSEALYNTMGTEIVELEPQLFQNKRFMHATKYNFNSQVLMDLTPGNSTVTEILAWNSAKKALYYILAPGDKPWLRQLWVSNNGFTKCLSCKQSSCHSVSSMMSPKGSYGVITCSSTNTPPETFFLRSEEESLTILKNNSRLADKLSTYKLPMTLFNTITLRKDVIANVKLLLPSTVKKDEQYPLIIRVYAGPGTTRVKDNYDLEYYNAYLATNRSFIVASIDVRGSGVMGVEPLYAVNNALGTVEVTDTLEAIGQLINMYNFIDPKRVGVWGWSYGGYATTMMLIQDQKKIITCGAAVAPVTSWLYYDSIYTERYMDTPQNNPIGYRSSDLMASAEKLRGRMYLLVHGTGDDNVHYQHSLQLAKVLQHLDIPFEQMSYTDETHSLLGVSRHFYHTLDHFWTECFNSTLK